MKTYTKIEKAMLTILIAMVILIAYTFATILILITNDNDSLLISGMWSAAAADVLAVALLGLYLKHTKM